MLPVLVSAITGYILLMNIIGFIIMGVDKRKAVKNAWRIPERVLFTVAFTGGGVGCYLGMQLFRHKTKHWKFQVFVPLAAIIYILLLLKLYQIV